MGFNTGNLQAIHTTMLWNGARQWHNSLASVERKQWFCHVGLVVYINLKKEGVCDRRCNHALLTAQKATPGLEVELRKFPRLQI